MCVPEFEVEFESEFEVECEFKSSSWSSRSSCRIRVRGQEFEIELPSSSSSSSLRVRTRTRIHAGNLSLNLRCPPILSKNDCSGAKFRPKTTPREPKMGPEGPPQREPSGNEEGTKTWPLCNNWTTPLLLLCTMFLKPPGSSGASAARCCTSYSPIPPRHLRWLTHQLQLD